MARTSAVETRTQAVSPESIFGGEGGGTAAGAPAAGGSPPAAGAAAGGACWARMHGAVMASSSNTLRITLATLNALCCLIMPFVLLMTGAGRSLRFAGPRIDPSSGLLGAVGAYTRAKDQEIFHRRMAGIVGAREKPHCSRTMARLL